jgi:hypothetical protein
MENTATVEMLMVHSDICQYMHYELQTKLDYMASTHNKAAHSFVLNKILSM